MKKILLAVLAASTLMLTGCFQEAEAAGWERPTPPWETYHNDHLSEGPQGVRGRTGSTGEVGNQGVAGVNGESYSNLEFNQGMASISAMANIPALSNRLDGSTGVGVGLGSYNSRGAVALGVVHQEGDWNFKASMARARHSGSTAFGVGAMFAF